jgi:hypothetical protein
MKIPIFVSCPTDLGPDQEKSHKLILDELENLQLEPRALGRSDYPTDFPLREVLLISRHCAGGIILGFSQFETDTGTWKKGINGEEKKQTELVKFPTPWNQLEAGILFGLQKPLLIFRESKISGGVFDPGVTDVFVHDVPFPPLDSPKKDALRLVFLKWSSKVRSHYYGE